jgi:hypothetical protein
MSPPNGSGAPPVHRGSAADLTADRAATVRTPDHSHDIATLKRSAVLYALRLRPNGRRRHPDDVVLTCSACGGGHRFRGFGEAFDYTRRLPCRPSVTAHIQVVAVFPRLVAGVPVERRAAA